MGNIDIQNFQAEVHTFNTAIRMDFASLLFGHAYNLQKTVLIVDE